MSLSRWKATEPVRLYLYAVLVPLIAVAVAYGIVQAEQAALWLAAGAAVLGVPATEAARNQVTPWPPVVDDQLDQPEQLDDQLLDDGPGRHKA